MLTRMTNSSLLAWDFPKVLHPRNSWTVGDTDAHPNRRGKCVHTGEDLKKAIVSIYLKAHVPGTMLHPWQTELNRVSQLPFYR